MTQIYRRAAAGPRILECVCRLFLAPALAVSAPLSTAPLSTAQGQDRGDRPVAGIVAAADWPLDAVTVSGGKRYEGLIQFERPGEMEFVEVVRPPGRPMYLVVRPIDPRQVVDRRRIDKQQRAELRLRVARFRNRSRIEAGRVEDVLLQEERLDGRTFRLYRGNWFSLRSTADEETTRRSIVRIEQIFRAYRQLIPPKTQPRDELHVLLLGSTDQYRTFLRRRGWQFQNPAVYLADENRIVAGSELTRFAERLNAVRRENGRLLERYEQLKADMPERLIALANQLADGGLSREEIGQEVAAQRLVWTRQYNDMLRRVDEVNRRNDTKFSELAGPMFTRLYHEAFHAYLENYVYPQQQFDVPRWLNEGLAQVFQNGQLDDEDTLRIDAPERRLLGRLKDDLRSQSPMPLSALFSSPADAFVSDHQDTSSRHYLYAWGVAYYLAFYQNLLGTDALDRYVAEDADPATRFERLVQEPTADFERRWRATVLEMKPPR